MPVLKILNPVTWSRTEASALLMFRLLVGAFLIWGVSDNVLSAQRMADFAAFLAANQFPWPDGMARLSVWAQLICGVGFCLGLLVRWLGVICAINFIVAVAMVDIHGGLRQSFPSLMLVAFGGYIAARGAGRISLDNLLFRQRSDSID